MMENEQQRAIRRGISRWLTARVNDVNTPVYANVRAEVIKSLSQLDQRFRDLDQSLKDTYHLREDKYLIDFYMKGGNAYDVEISDDVTSGGDSDWDTQVVIDPWAPIPIQEIVHGRIEDIALDQLNIAAQKVANVIQNGFPPGDENPDFASTINALWELQKNQGVIPGTDLSNYELTLDNPQTVRRVFDHERTGLWLYESTGLKSDNPDVPSKWMPGMIFNDSIGPFILIRLGYTWHVNIIENPNVDIPHFSINKPILMELIDVTIPRRDTIEGVSVWEAIVDKEISLIKKPVSINQTQVNLPFPDIYYHVREQLDMICEVADGSSRHQDKLGKRFKRLFEIYKNDRDNVSKIKRIISQHVGVDNIAAEYENLKRQGDGKIQLGSRIYNILENFAGVGVEPFYLSFADGNYWSGPGEDAYKYGLAMMSLVESALEKQDRMYANGNLTSPAEEMFRDTESNQLRQLMQALGCKVANSNDLVLMNLLKTNDYLKLNEIGLSGIFKSEIACVENTGQLNHLIRVLTSKVNSRQSRGLSELYREYNTVRQNGLSYEFTMVVFSESKACQIITATTATPAELSFRGRFNLVASLDEIARQRKMAASLIDDYIIKTALSRQYEACKEIVNLSTH